MMLSTNSGLVLRIIFLLCIPVFNVCSAVHMTVDPQLNTNFDMYPIKKMPEKGIGFGTYVSSNVHHGWTRGNGTTINIDKNEYKSHRYRQPYSFDFKGASNWKADCIKYGKSQQIGNVGARLEVSVGFGNEIGIDCNFARKSEEISTFSLKFSGTRLVEAQGSFSNGTQNFRVVPNLKIQESPFRLGTPTGYYIYSGNKIVAGVDKINKKGPIWLSKDLSPDDKDRVSLVIVSLLLIKE